MRPSILVKAALGVCAFFAADSFGGIKVLICSSASTPAWSDDIIAKINATGRVQANAIDVFNIAAATPTLAQLNGYDVVFVLTDNSPADRVALGNVLADFVDAGGGVVETTFGFYNAGLIGIEGRWRADNYATMGGPGQTSGTVQTIGARLVPGHPILEGVASFSGGTSSYRNTAAILPGAYRIANWNDGASTPLVATRHDKNGKVAGLNFFPPSSDARGDFWDASTQGGVLMANAINFVSNNSTDVLICGAPALAAWADEVRDRLLEGGRVGGRVDLFNVSTGTPAPALLAAYDTVVVYADAGLNSPALLGDRLADYVDLGGGVVQMTFANVVGASPAGRYSSGGYDPILPGNNNNGVPLTLGTRHIPRHPLLKNIASFAGGSSSYHSGGALRAGAIAVADWSNGRPLIAVTPGKKGRVVGLNFYPPSSVSRADFWDRSTDGMGLMGNAIDWAARNDTDVLVLGDDLISGTQADIVSKLRPLINGTIVAIDYNTATPSTARLRRFDAVLVYTNGNPTDPAAIGDRLADFVDGGGGVVDMYGSNLASFGPTGRWRAQGYSGLLAGNVASPGTLTLGSKLFPFHPVLARVADVNIGTLGAHNNGGIRPGSTLLATLSNGQPLAVERSTGAGRVVTLNYFPASSDIGVGTWVPGTDAGQLMANALHYTARSDIEALVVATQAEGTPEFQTTARAINQTGRIRKRVDILDNTAGNPPLGLLRAYDAALVWSNSIQPDGVAWGNTVADYADRGGGVVTASGAHASASFGLQGRWLTAPYTPASFGAGALFANRSIATRYRPDHPVLAGVTTFVSDLADFNTTSFIGERLADYNDGRPVVAEAKRSGARQTLAINAYPPLISPATRGGLLMNNALVYVAAERPCLVDFNDDGFLDFFDLDAFIDCFDNNICPQGRDADFNGDGFIDFFDLDAFVNAFDQGC